jgi:subtilisin family serine protease
MKFKPTLVAVAVLTLAGSVQAQVFANKEAETQTKFLTAVGAPQAWARGITGKGVIIGIIDNGFDINHSDIKNNVISLTNPKVKGSTVDAIGVHGTQMASIAAGRLDGWGTVGVAPDAKLVLFQANSSVSSSRLSSDGVNMDSVLEGMKLAEKAGATVINLSLGSNIHPGDQAKIVEVSPGIFRAPPESVAQIRTNSKSYLIGKSMVDVAAFANATSTAVIVAASGNAGAKYAQMPAAFATQTDANGNLLMGGRVLIVGNVVGDGKGGWTMNPKSNQAGTICNSFTGNVCNDKYYVKDFYVVAPGTGMYGAIPDAGRTATGIKAGGTNGIGGVTGSSPAAAVVSGGVALIKQAWPQLTSAQIVHLIKTTAKDLGAPGVDEVYGWGMVDFDKATQPQGLLKIATFKGYDKAIPLTASGVASSGSASFSTSSVLQNVQGLDSYNRNYTLDMTKAVVANPVATYRASSSYLAMSPAGYNEMSAPVNENYSIKMMQSQAGTASEITYTEQSSSYSVQYGTMSEKSGFLGNYGAGAMALGDSSTSYLQLGTEHKFGSVAVFGSYGFGTTRAGSVQDSMIQLGNRISSDTWRMGVAKNNVFQNKDALSFSVVSPVSVRNGSATVTGVTGYEFTDNGDGADAKAIVSTETINLRASAKPMDLVLGYTVAGKGYDRVNVNIARQFNVGGVAGNTANSIGVMAVKSF